MMNIKPYMPYIVAILIAVIVMMLLKPKQAEAYKLRPSDIDIDEIGDGDISNLPVKLECVPGSEPGASAYTKDLTPGGICGAQAAVAEAADYEITGGIGGSLIEE